MACARRAGLGEKGVGVEAIGLWEGFEATWPVMTTPDAGSEYVLAKKNMSFPGWGHALAWLPLWNTIVLLSWQTFSPFSCQEKVCTPFNIIHCCFWITLLQFRFNF